ncbi:hypothetical protein Hdeb2414_s0273g00853791 [Helianthus debilis subsp. tardiflorus]
MRKGTLTVKSIYMLYVRLILLFMFVFLVIDLISNFMIMEGSDMKPAHLNAKFTLKKWQ